MNHISFDQLPQAISDLQQSVKKIETLLLSKKQESPLPEELLLTVQEAAEFLSLSVPTIYSLIHKGELPVMKRSKRCYFSKKELMDYIRQGRRKTIRESEQEAHQFIADKEKGLNNLKKKGGRYERP